MEGRVNVVHPKVLGRFTLAEEKKLGDPPAQA